MNIEQMAAEGIQQELEKTAKDLLKRLGLQSVAIFSTYADADDNTRSLLATTGNWYATYGTVQNWIIRADERDRVNVRKEDGESGLGT